MDSMLRGIAANIDNINVTGTTQEEFLQYFCATSNPIIRISPKGWKMCILPKIDKISQFIFDKNGQRHDPGNIDGINHMTVPADVPILCSYLGLICHYRAFFYQKCNRYTGPHNRFLGKKKKMMELVTWKQTDKIKSLLSSELLLTHYNPSLHHHHDVIVSNA